jgi:hypothetical protein
MLVRQKHAFAHSWQTTHWASYLRVSLKYASAGTTGKSASCSDKALANISSPGKL